MKRRSFLAMLAAVFVPKAKARLPIVEVQSITITIDGVEWPCDVCTEIFEWTSADYDDLAKGS